MLFTDDKKIRGQKVKDAEAKFCRREYMQILACLTAIVFIISLYIRIPEFTTKLGKDLCSFIYFLKMIIIFYV